MSYTWREETRKKRWVAVCNFCGDEIYMTHEMADFVTNRDDAIDSVHGPYCTPRPKAKKPKRAKPMPRPLKDPESNTYAGAVRQWRLWRTVKVNGNYRLKALTNDHIWKPGENEVLDMTGSNAGFYGFSGYDQFDSQEGYHRDLAMGHGLKSGFVLGSILCYGRMIVGQFGARAEFAVPEYFISPENPDDAIPMFELVEYYQGKMISDEQAQELKCGLVPYRKPVSLEEVLGENDQGNLF